MKRFRQSSVFNWREITDKYQKIDNNYYNFIKFFVYIV